MSSPKTPAATQSNVKSPSSYADFKRHLATHAGSPITPSGQVTSASSSMPTTPVKLSDIDPAIILSVKSRNPPVAAPNFSQHLRNDSDSSIITIVKKREAGSSSADASRAGPAHLERPWRTSGDPFVAEQQTNTASLAATNDPGTQTEEVTQEESSSRSDRSPTPQPREDRDTTNISAENAQGFFKAKCCVFVANLAASRTDQELEAAVLDTFSQFGDLFVKIRRDQNAMPFAFCQYTNEDDAAKALASGHGLEIFNRACRVELSKGNRSIYLSRTDGQPITADEARLILAKEGPIDKLWFPTDTDKQIYHLSDGIWVTFTFFQDARDAQTTFKDSQEFRLEIPYSPEEHERKRIASFKYSPATITPQRGGRGSQRWSSNGSRLGNSSIFIGNIPMSATIQSVRECMENCGSIRSVEIVSKLNNHGGGFNTFGFIEFVNEGGVRAALASNILLLGRRLRIEIRESQESLNRNFAATSSPRVRGPPTPRTPVNREAPVKNAIASPSAMAPIYEGTQQAQGQPHTPVQPQVFGQQIAWGSPVNAYGNWWAPAQGEAQATLPTFVPITSQQAMMSQYPLSAYLPNQYQSPAQWTYPMVYPTVGQGDAIASANNQETALTLANTNAAADTNNGDSR